MKQVLTVSCKLEVSPEQSIKIDATLQAFAKACEYVNQTVPPTVMNELAMQSLIYHNVRDMFGLSAQLAIHAIRRVSGNRKTSKKDGKPDYYWWSRKVSIGYRKLSTWTTERSKS